jgi:hypothetical protein
MTAMAEQANADTTMIKMMAREDLFIIRTFEVQCGPCRHSPSAISSRHSRSSSFRIAIAPR